MAKKKQTTLFTWWDVYGDDVLNICERSAKTAVQVLASAGFFGAFMGGNIAGVKAALIAAGSALLSAAWNAALAWSRS